MSVVYIVLPLAMLIALLAVVVFVYQVRRGQFDDLDSPGLRVLLDEESTRAGNSARRRASDGEGDRAIDYDRMVDLYDDWLKFEDDLPYFVEQCRGVRGPVLELMAGTGRLSIPLVEAGVELTCVDYSEPMLGRLRAKLVERGLSATVLHADVREMSFEKPFPLALLPFNAFAELLGDDDRRRALRRVREALIPGGRFLCTLHNPPVRLRGVTPEFVVWGSVPRPGGGGTLTLRMRSEHDPATGVVEGEQVFDVRDAAGERLEERRIPIRFVLHSREAFEALVTDAGFEVSALYGDYLGSPYVADESPYMIWHLTRT